MSESRLIKNKTILVLANFDIGLYKFRKTLLETLLHAGNAVYISLPDGEYIPELQRMGCQFIKTDMERRGMNPLRDLHLFFQYQKILKEIRPDLVITYTIKPNIYGGAACRILKIPYAANITGLGSAIESGGFLKNLVFSMYRFALKRAQTVFFENEGNRDCFLSASVVEKSQTCTLNGAGINTEEYPLLSYPDEPPVHFLFVGRIMHEKGIDELFSSVRRLKARYGDRLVLDIVGLFEESYQTEIESLQKDHTLIFHGYQQNVLPFYQAAHCVVLPSYHEGMSNVLLEGAACGRPLITSRIHGCMEAVDENKNGFLCDAKSADSLYDAMSRFMELSKEEKKQFGLAGRRRMEQLFDKKKVVNATMERLVNEQH